MYQKVITRHGHGFLVDYAQNGQLALCMVRLSHGWVSRHYLTSTLVFIHNN
jgi:hypothetical protein